VQRAETSSANLLKDSNMSVQKSGYEKNAKFELKIPSGFIHSFYFFRLKNLVSW
jgi:hypothetical protein